MDKELISDWFDYYADDVFRFLIYYLSTTDVENLVQEVFMRAIDPLLYARIIKRTVNKRTISTIPIQLTGSAAAYWK